MQPLLPSQLKANKPKQRLNNTAQQCTYSDYDLAIALKQNTNGHEQIRPSVQMKEAIIASDMLPHPYY